MKVRVLGCSGAIARGCRTTSFLIDDNILIDAGTGVGDLTLEEMQNVNHVFLSHSHLDHVAALPLMLDAVSSMRERPVQVHALPATISALQAHIFNNIIWPDFSSIPSLETPFLQYRPFTVGDSLELGGTALEILPACHTVPAVGFAVRGIADWWIFSGDTGRNQAFWDRINSLPVAALVIETAFSNRESDLALRSGHLSPVMLTEELAQMRSDSAYPVYITHTKPSETDLVMQEIQVLGPRLLTRTPVIHLLEAGLVLEI